MSIAERLFNLLNYVIEQAKKPNPKEFCLNGYKDFHLYKADLEGLPGVALNVIEDGENVWLRIERLQTTAPPQLKARALQKYILLPKNLGGLEPCVNESALVQSIDADFGALTSSAADREGRARRGLVLDALHEYLPEWREWARTEAAVRDSIRIYGDLFALEQQIRSGETAKPYEAVWGVGMTSWKLEIDRLKGLEKIDFQYPLITQAVEITIEESSMAISIRPRAISELKFEFDTFSACGITSIPKIEESYKDWFSDGTGRILSPFDAGSFEPLLKRAAGNLHERGRYEPRQEKPFPIAEFPVVTDAWVLLARPKSKNTQIEDIERFKRRIQTGDPIPACVADIVTPPTDEVEPLKPISFRGISSSGDSNAVTHRELYFPLPYNQEQVTIVEQLERSDGVVVQGPPGTGKTHTIANIVCHYLAMGRKVLVTAKGDQALRVLQSKIPEGVRRLSVSLTAGEQDGMNQFESSIESIIHHISQLSPDTAREEISRILSEIDGAHGDLSTIDNRVNDIALNQLADIDIDGVPMRAQQMAELVVSGNARHAWFDDLLSPKGLHAPPVTNEAVSVAREARRKLGSDLAYVNAKVPSSNYLLSSEEVTTLHTALLNIHEIEIRKAAGLLPPLRAATHEVFEHARRLLVDLEEAISIARNLEKTGEVWTFDLRRKFRQSEFLTERGAFEALFSEIDFLGEARARFLKRPVAISDSAIAAPEIRAVLQRAVETGKPFGLFSFRETDLKTQVNQIKVAGLPPCCEEDWQHALEYVELDKTVLSFAERWNKLAETLKLPPVQTGVKEMQAIERVTNAARQAYKLASRFDTQLPVAAARVFPTSLTPLIQGTSSEMMTVCDHIKSHLRIQGLAREANLIASIRSELVDTTGKVSDELRAFFDNSVGNHTFGVERISSQYAELIAELRRIETLKPSINAVLEVAQVFARAGATKLASRVTHSEITGVGEDDVLPSTWREAWNWARIRSHLNKIEARDELVELAHRRRGVEARMVKLYEDMVSKSAWLATKTGASPRMLSALETFKTAIRKIGKGTGTNADRHRRDAQKAMRDAQGAVPCWIMNHYRVSETLPSILGSFDLVVVDEASQSDLWALPSVLRGKKLLVVGDDKQVSPDGSFIEATHIQALRDRLLSDQPFAAVLTPEKSLYDIASTVFAAQKVMLSEHFRCVPAIIAYSNRFYDGRMQPLRIPKESERIDPPLVDIYVASGNRNTKDVNHPEADAIASEICAILRDKRFAKRSIGVVSLLGPDQAKHIDLEVRSRCDALELMQRKFLCGDARIFQGSERDIMFLSMVADSNKPHALSGNNFEQRFNVAGSRARDRMYLVRSVKVSDLSSTDLRAGLISHFSKPVGVSSNESGNLIELCESGFERQVYEALVGCGYRVIPQVKAGSFRIDMVVEGEGDARLAIECDGDAYHGPDRWSADMNRQRILERAGWIFWRCFASTWSLHRDEVFEELLGNLAAMGIEPLGALDRMPSLVEYREWVPNSESDPAREEIRVDPAISPPNRSLGEQLAKYAPIYN